MTDPRWAFDMGTAALWFLLAALGIVLRVRRLLRLRQIVLVAPVDPRDAAYLASVKLSTVLRLGVKVVFLIGACIPLFGLFDLWWVWRVGVVVALLFMLTETANVDAVRARLGMPLPSGRGTAPEEPS